jgi:hypothetical protein
MRKGEILMQTTPPTQMYVTKANFRLANWLTQK